MSFEAWLAFCVTETVLCFIPGPAVLFVVSMALANGRRPGLAASLGILAGNTFYFALSAMGVAAVIAASGQLFTLIKWLGAAYLVWLGLRMLLSRAQADVGSARPSEPQAASHALLRGFVVQAANPKAIIFFVALLPQFINPKAGVGLQVLVLGISSVVIEFCVLLLYVLVAVRARAVAGLRWTKWVERVGGGFLLAAGTRLALIK